MRDTDGQPLGPVQSITCDGSTNRLVATSLTRRFLPRECSERLQHPAA